MIIISKTTTTENRRVISDKNNRKLSRHKQTKVERINNWRSIMHLSLSHTHTHTLLIVQSTKEKKQISYEKKIGKTRQQMCLQATVTWLKSNRRNYSQLTQDREGNDIIIYIHCRYCMNTNYILKGMSSVELKLYQSGNKLSQNQLISPTPTPLSDTLRHLFTDVWKEWL